jgi:hypothetical protein
MRSIPGIDAPSSAGNQEDIGHFETPDLGHDRHIINEALK